MASVNGRELLGLLLRIRALGPFDRLRDILLVLIHGYLGLERVFIHLLEKCVKLLRSFLLEITHIKGWHLERRPHTVASRLLSRGLLLLTFAKLLDIFL